MTENDRTENTAATRAERRANWGQTFGHRERADSPTWRQSKEDVTPPGRRPEGYHGKRWS